MLENLISFPTSYIGFEFIPTKKIISVLAKLLDSFGEFVLSPVCQTNKLVKIIFCPQFKIKLACIQIYPTRKLHTRIPHKDRIFFINTKQKIFTEVRMIIRKKFFL